MASDSCFLSEDQFLCSICLEVFSEPVSIPCGHNFCKACISRYWEGKQQCQCPLCKETFNTELKLCINTAFREIVEDFKKHRQATSCEASQVLARPGQVSCDCCLGNKLRASKTCLVCLASYCETHLEPHQRVEALKRHTLTDPVLNLDDKICMKHNRMLEFFCRDDLTCICVLCTDHSDHDIVALEKAFVNKKGPAGKKKVAIKTKTCRKKSQRSRAGVQPKRDDDATPNHAVPNQLQAPHIWWLPPEGPQQHVSSLSTANTGFYERGFWHEIQVIHRVGWRLKLVSESVSGLVSLAQISQNGPHFITFNNTHRAPPSEPLQLFLMKTPTGVLVFLNYESELLYFHDPQTDIMIYSLTGSKFIKRYFLCFIPTTRRIDTQQLLGTVQMMKACLPTSSNIDIRMFVVCGFLFFMICMLFLQVQS